MTLFALAFGVLRFCAAETAGQASATNQVVTWSNGPAVFRMDPSGPNGKGVQVFDHFVPTSLNNLAWTNLIAHTNGRSAALWATRIYPTNWPKGTPMVRWNTNSVLWGARGLTALSPCWEDDGGGGQAPVTALTRRHGYTRGHSMGADGFTKARNGKRICFLTARDELIIVKIKLAVVRTAPTSHKDYTLFLFDRDLPDSIEPITGILLNDVAVKIPFVPSAPWPFARTEQSGLIGLSLPGFSASVWKPGDSGSPDVLLLPNGLAFSGGRSTAAPCPEMQKDMDSLCQMEHLDPHKYQIKLLDVSAFPSF